MIRALLLVALLASGSVYAGPAEEGYALMVDRETANKFAGVIEAEGYTCKWAAAAILSNLEKLTHIVMCDDYSLSYVVRLINGGYTVGFYVEDEMF